MSILDQNQVVQQSHLFYHLVLVHESFVPLLHHRVMLLITKIELRGTSVSQFVNLMCIQHSKSSVRARYILRYSGTTNSGIRSILLDQCQCVPTTIRFEMDHRLSIVIKLRRIWCIGGMMRTTLSWICTT